MEEGSQTPTGFPRNSWLNRSALGMPPFRKGEYKYEACYAARHASRTWSRVLGLTPDIDEDGDELECEVTEAELPDDTIDDTCFMLALFDKVWEM